MGYRAEESVAYGNLGSAYFLQGGYGKAIEYYAQHLEIAKEVGDRAEEGKAYSNLGIAYFPQGDSCEGH